MQGTGTGAAAMLVGSAEDVGGRPDAATVTLAREEIQEALASDAPLDLILAVQAGDTEPRDVRVTWQREDLETVLGKVETGPVTFSFDRAELYRALEHPDFEGHGMREIVLLVAAASSSAALMASTASGQVLDAGGGGAVGAVMDASGGGTTGAVMDAAGGGMTGAVMDAAGGSGGAGAAVVPGHGEASTAGEGDAAWRRPAWRGAWTPPVASGHATRRRSTRAASSRPRVDATTARDLATPAATTTRPGQARGIGQTVPGNDEATLVARGIDPAIATAIGSGDATTARDLATPAAIHDEAGASARGIGQTVPGNDEATLVARGIDPAIATAIGSGDATTARDLATPAAPAAGSSFDLPSIDAGTAAVVGGLAGAGLLILGGAFAARRQRVTPV